MTVLVIAPHADDEVLGMGGSIARFAEAGRPVVIAVVTGHGEEPHPLSPPAVWETVRAECREAARVLGADAPIFRELPAVCLDHLPAYRINSVIAEVIETVGPEEIYVPFANDLHKDHGAIAYAVSVATRPYIASESPVRRVLAYETLSETHLAPPYLEAAFQPNVFVNITDTLERKIAAMRAYASQIQPDNQPRSAAALRSLAHLRGSHIGVPAAEAFVLLGEYQR